MTTVDNADSGTFDAVLMLYVGCAKLADGELDEREAKRILELTRKHSEGLAPGYAEQSLRDVVQTLASAGDAPTQLARVVDAAERVAQRLGPEAKAGIVDELRSIARANGENTAGEQGFIEAVAKTLGVA